MNPTPLAKWPRRFLSSLAKPSPYQNLPEEVYRDILLSIGLPEPLASGLARWEVAASHDALFDDSQQISQLLGRPTTPMAHSVKTALSQIP